MASEVQGRSPSDRLLFGEGKVRVFIDADNPEPGLIEYVTKVVKVLKHFTPKYQRAPWDSLCIDLQDRITSKKPFSKPELERWKKRVDETEISGNLELELLMPEFIYENH